MWAGSRDRGEGGGDGLKQGGGSVVGEGGGGGVRRRVASYEVSKLGWSGRRRRVG